MNILQVVSSNRTSGAEKHLVVLSQSLRERGHNVTAVCPPGGWLTERLNDAGVPTVEIPMRDFHGLRVILELRRIIRRDRVDLIHTHLTRATYLGFLTGLLTHVPVITTMHVHSRDFAYRYLPRCNHWYVAVSNHLRQALIARGVPASRVQTVYNGTEFALEEEVTPAASLSVRAELGLPAEAELVGQFGRVDSFKGAPILVKAARTIVERCPRAYFVFVGHAEPGIQQALWEMASEARVDDRLRFTGVRNDVRRLMDAMEVITLPSVFEACSLAIIEAMAIGKPVVATRAGGNPELVEDNATGLLVERNPEALAEAITDLLLDGDRRLAMGRAGQARARSLFSARVMAENMERFYQHVLKR